MNQIYPPIIEGILPAFYKEGEQIKITVPFTLNQAVSPSEVIGMSLKIKTVQTGTHLHEVTTQHSRDFSVNGDNIYATFYVTSDKMRVGQFYKLQIAYVIQNKEKTTISQYSGAGLAKYTIKPELTIQGFKPKVLNTFQTNFTGCYEQEDSTEKVYSYCFNVYGPDKTLYWSTGEKLHNSSNDSSPTYSEDRYLLNYDIIAEKIHYIQYIVTTVNGLTTKSPLYKMIRRPSVSCNLNVNVYPELHFDNGYIAIYLDEVEGTSSNLVTGAYSLLRTSEISSYSSWETLFNFTLHNERPQSLIYTDFLIEHGVHYQYALVQYNSDGLYSEKIYSDKILADFEDSFLYDGKRQLKLRYNTKISKFSSTHLEAKTDTIGGKYPVIFRNGHVNYKEFQLSALVSYYMDEEYLFMPLYNLNTEDVTTNHTSENIRKEQMFKNEVLEWLNDGTPKLFRSPHEGMFIVRLIKISMAPEQKLGRLLHNFSATAYEIAEVNYENLKLYGFITYDDTPVELTQFKEIDFSKQTNDWFKWDLEAVRSKNLLDGYKKVQSITLSGMASGDYITIEYNNGQEENIVIGPFGTYHTENNDGIVGLYLRPRVTRVADLGAYFESPKNESDHYESEDAEKNKPLRFEGIDHQFSEQELKESGLYDDEAIAEISESFINYFKTYANKNLNSVKYAQGLYFLEDPATGKIRPAKEVLGDKEFNIANLIELNFDKLGYNLYEMTNKTDGMLMFSYIDTFVPTFYQDGAEITNMKYPDCSIAQFIGQVDILQEINKLTPKYQLEKFYKIILRPRPVQIIYGNPSPIDGTDDYRVYLENPQNNINNVLSANLSDINPQIILHSVQQEVISERSIITGKYQHLGYWDRTSEESSMVLSRECVINNSRMIIEKETEIVLKDFNTIQQLFIGNGLIAEVYWQYRQYDFLCEKTDSTLIEITKQFDDISSEDINYISEKKKYLTSYLSKLQTALKGGELKNVEESING